MAGSDSLYKAKSIYYDLLDIVNRALPGWVGADKNDPKSTLAVKILEEHQWVKRPAGPPIVTLALGQGPDLKGGALILAFTPAKPN